MPFTSTYSLATSLSETAGNTYTVGDQRFREIGGLAGGGFVVGYDTLLDFWSATDSHVGSYFVAAGFIEQIVGFTDGRVAVMSRSADAHHSVQIFSSAGIQLNVTDEVANADPLYDSLAVLTNGYYTFTSSFYLSEFDRYFVRTDVYRGDGSLVNQVFSYVNDDTGPLATVGLTNDNFVVAYDDHSSANGTDLRYVIYNSDGDELSSDRIGKNTDDSYYFPAVAALPGGGFAMAYDYTDRGNTYQVALRVFDANGQLLGVPHAVVDTSFVTTPQIAVLQNGFIAVGWVEAASGGGLDSYFSIFDESGNSAGLPTRVLFGHSAAAGTDMPSLAARLSGELVFGATDATVDGSGTGVAVTGVELVRTTVGDNAGETFVGDALQDVVHAGGGNDLVIVYEGRDEVHGDAGQDYLSGGADPDALYGGSEGDTAKGDDGDDLILGDEGNDILSGGAGKDLVFGGTEDDSVSGDDGDDYLYGEDGADTLAGGAGNDTLDGGVGRDTLEGGDGDDTYLLASVTAIDRLHYVFDTVVESAQRAIGIDTVVITSQALKNAPHSYALTDNVENGVVVGGYDFALTGNTLANSLTGNAAANTLDGAKGRDTLTGGAGDDTYILRDVSKDGFYDTVVEAANGGVDTVLLSGVGDHGYTLGANVENGTIFGNATAIQLEGNGLDNALTSDRGGDTLIGRAGADTLTGGKGADRFLYQDEVIGTAGGWGQDVIADFKQGEDRIVFYDTKRIDDFGDLRIANRDGHAVILTGGGESIELIGVKARSLTTADFEFLQFQPVAAAPHQVWQAQDLGAHAHAVAHPAWLALA